MSIHKPTERLLVSNNGLVQTSGGSTRMAKGVIGFANRALANTAEGIPLVNTFDETGDYELRYGIHDGPVTKSSSNLAWRSLPFRLNEVIDIKASAPKLGSSVDEIWIGYDGINDDSAIELENGQTVEFDIVLKGEGLAIAGQPKGEYVQKLVITAPTTGEVNMQKLILEAVEQFNRTTLPSGQSINDFVVATPIDSTKVAPTGTDYTIYTLTVPNQGDSNQQALVKQQYPDLDIKFLGSINGGASYTVAIEGVTAPEDYVIVNTEITIDCEDYAGKTDTQTTFSWVAGETCTAVEREYTLVLPDTICGEQRTEDVQAYYPELTITAGESTNCQTVYTTNVLTNFVCEECSPIIIEAFKSEAPQPFDLIDWVASEEVFDETAKLGIRFVGKQTISTADSPYDKFIPFVYDFTRLSVSGGYPLTVVENLPTRNAPFPVRVIRRGYNPSGMGYEYKSREEQSRIYFTNLPSHCDNIYAEAVLGEESLLKNTAQYVMYSITIRRKRYAQSLSQTHEENVKYDILVEVGKHEDIETLVNVLATSAELPTVAAYTI